MTKVTYEAPAKVSFETEQITDKAGCRQTGGSGASCWGFNQSNIVRYQDQLYAMSWRDDLTLRVYRRLGKGRWQPSPPLPEVPQNGNLLVGSDGRVHVISGANASFHAVFDPPGQVQTFDIRRDAAADSRFGASINERDQIMAGGGLDAFTWYVLDPGDDYRVRTAGNVSNDQARGYNFVVLRGSEAHALCGDDYFVAGEQYPNQTVTWRDLNEGGKLRTVVTPKGLYQTLKVYYSYCPDVFTSPDDWHTLIVNDVGDTWDGTVRGATEQQDLLVDAQGRVHLVYYENRQPVGTVWAAAGQDQSGSRLFHAVGPPGGPFASYELGNFNSGRLYEDPGGRIHYLLTKGRRGDASELWYAVERSGPEVLSEPVRLEMPSRFWHLFVNTTRAGGSVVPFIDCYWTGAYQQNSNEVWYGRVLYGE